MSKIVLYLESFRVCGGGPRSAGWPSLQGRPTVSEEAGQATAEYGLVMLAAAAIAGLLLAWAAGTDAVGRIMDAVVASIIGDIS